MNVPAETVVIPEYVFAPERERVAEPILVTVPVDVAMGSSTLIAPVLVSKVSAYVPVNAEPLDTSKMSVSASA